MRVVDLTPGYRELAPPPALRGSVACVWVRVADGGGPVLVVPDACTDVIWTRGQGVSVAGPDTSAQVAELDAGEVLVGLRFRPGAGGGGLGVPLEELRDLRVDAADVDRAFDLDGELAPADVVRRFVEVAARREGDALVQRVAAGMVRGERIEVPLSARQLRRRFHAAVGYGPKTLERVLRFRNAVAAIDGGRTDLAGIAFDAGYADQAHLTRECTRLAGLPPAKLMRARGARPPGAGSAGRRTR